MRICALIIVCMALAGVSSARAEPGGCLKYGAGGAVAGHFVGKGHAVLGAAGGCAAGMYKRHQSRKQEAAQRRAENPRR